MAYYYAIPAMKQLLDSERAALEAEYNGLRGASSDGTPRGSSPGRPAEAQVERVIQNNVRDRLQAVEVRICVLEADREAIGHAVDALNGEYKKLLILRYRDRCKWTKIAVMMGMPERTAKFRQDRALDRIGQLLDETPMPEELLGRASRARH